MRGRTVQENATDLDSNTMSEGNKIKSLSWDDFSTKCEGSEGCYSTILSTTLWKDRSVIQQFSMMVKLMYQNTCHDYKHTLKGEA